MMIDLNCEDPRWQGLEGWAEAAFGAVSGALELGDGWAISILGCDDARIAALNAAFRGKDTPTNVLSWPSAERGAAAPGRAPLPPDPGDPELGDIAIAYDTCTAEADAAGLDFGDHVTHLLVHAILHLLGYDHETADDADRMEALEVVILARLGIADPYSSGTFGKVR